MLKLIKYFAAIFFIASATSALADVSVPLYFTAEQGIGKPAGKVVISETKYGLLFTPDLHDLIPGIHGFHIHENPSCDKNGMAAGGHLDPKNTGKHLGPYNNKGHLGDLPALYVNTEGAATLPVLAPRIRHIADIKNHALMTHEGGDNYSDTPAKLGGGGARMVCGVIK